MNPEELQKFTVKAEKIVSQLEKNNTALKSLLDKIEYKNNIIAELKSLLSDLLVVADGIPYQELFSSDIETIEKVRKLLNNSRDDNQSI